MNLGQTLIFYSPSAPVSEPDKSSGWSMIIDKSYISGLLTLAYFSSNLKYFQITEMELRKKYLYVLDISGKRDEEITTIVVNRELDFCMV